MKLALTKRLYRKKFTKEKIQKLYIFIDWLLCLPEAFEIEYKEEIYREEILQHMAYISTIERFGIEKGKQQGIKKGEVIILQRLLKLKFGEIPAHYRALIEEAEADVLLLWADRVLEAETLKEIFEP